MDRRQFGPYQLEDLLGRGGMGEVYRAYDTSTGRVVAIKVLPPHLAEDVDFQQRFLREARTAASLHEPHVVPIHRFGEIDGRLYVDMRFIEGRDLAKVIEDGPISPQRAVNVVEQIAAALEAAHRAGLVHRDVKPSNVLLTHRDFAYLIDFGIARQVDDTRMTGTGQMVGSVAYMAPERFAHGQADTRADVYALTCVLHECLTGRLPYGGQTAGEQIAAHMMAPPPRPSSLGFPVALDEVMARGLAKDPAARYQTPDDLARAARSALGVGLAANAPAPVAGPTAPWRPAGPDGRRIQLDFARRPPWWKRHPVLLTAVVAALVTALSVTALIVANRQASGAAAGANVDIDGLLLSLRDVESIMGEQGMAVTSRGDSYSTDDYDPMKPGECSPILHIVDKDKIGADVVQMRSAGDYAPSDNYLPHVDQSVTQLPSAGAARNFFDTSAKSWQSCLNQDVSVNHLDGTPETNRFDDLKNESNLLSVRRTVVEAMDGFGCQHALAVKGAFIVAVRACNFALTDQGRDVATKIADKISA